MEKSHKGIGKNNDNKLAAAKQTAENKNIPKARGTDNVM